MPASPKSTADQAKPQKDSIASCDRSFGYSCYVLLLIPIILFLNSLYIPPTVISDSAVGLLALRNMLGGGAFNTIITPDPANVANDLLTFLTWWSPGQYLAPGFFIWLGTSYGVALSLTTLIATVTGVLGWMQVARSFGVSYFVLFVFVLGLNTFPYVTQRFLGYWGGEMLLFAIAPWALFAMRWSAHKRPIICFTISLLSAALLFFAKLAGLLVFATNVVAISLIALVNQRRLDSSAIAMWVASALAALCMMFWIGRGPVAADMSTVPFSWFPILFSVTGAAFSGIYGVALFLGHPWMQINLQWATGVLGPLGLLLIVWVWSRLRDTRYRHMAVLLLAIVLIYAIAVAITLRHLRAVSFEDRHFRYAGILLFLLLLTAADQWRAPLAKGLILALVSVLGLYGLRNYATSAYAQMRAGYYEPMSGISLNVSPAILEYIRSEVTRDNLQRPVALIPSPSAAIGLPRFRFIFIGWEQQPVRWAGRVFIGWEQQPLTWAGRAEKIFVVVSEEMLLSKQAEAILRSFTDYDIDGWSQMKLGGMIIYTQ